MTSNDSYKGRLKRLGDNYYKGLSYVHWTMCLQDKATGWLDVGHHEQLRPILVDALAREFMACPAYCLMPDHAHFLFIGYDIRSDQKLAVRWFRREWNRLLSPQSLQHQPYDHVVRDKDLARDAFADVAGYILRNPVRAGLVEDWCEWPYYGAIFPGYPALNPRKLNFWEDFWRAYQKHVHVG